MTNRIVIIGAGGHARVVCDAILLAKKYELVGFVDATVPVGTEILSGYKVIAAQSELDSLKGRADLFVVAIGNNKIRAGLFSKMKALMPAARVIHPSAVIGSGSMVGEGTVVLANAVINTNSAVGENSIVNCRVVVDHDSRVGSHVHLSIGTMVGSTSVIADGYLSSIGENIKPFSKIG